MTPSVARAASAPSGDAPSASRPAPCTKRRRLDSGRSWSADCAGRFLSRMGRLLRGVLWRARRCGGYFDATPSTCETGFAASRYRFIRYRGRPRLLRRQNRLHRKLGFPTLTKTFLLAEIDNICGELRTDAARGRSATGTTPDTPNEEQSNVPPRPRAGG
ncbi:hypothetical protein CBM2599_B140245 [Cupriavidus taiwanensis]|nr:hypothetical protein CBM2599_B140245 [Cupriavidus taiwanensis]SOY99371.1 hypothetical protein CBM2600_B60116 [Cupriavidus taiwanensis]